MIRAFNDDLPYDEFVRWQIAGDEIASDNPMAVAATVGCPSHSGEMDATTIKHGFLMWMAGGGIHGGVHYGSTDDIGYKAAENPVSAHDTHATILHLLGLDHHKLTCIHNGRRYRLTDVAGNVLHPIIS